MVAGENGLYIRFPDKQRDGPIHRISDATVRSDWLDEKNKPYYDKFLDGVHEAPPSFEDDLVEEAKVVDRAFAERNRHSVTEKYVDDCNKTLQVQLERTRAKEVPGPRRVQGNVPASPDDQNALTVTPPADGTYTIPGPLVPHGTSDRRRLFQLGGTSQKRLRVKSSPESRKSGTPSSSGKPPTPALSPDDGDAYDDDPLGWGPCVLGDRGH